MLQTLFNVLLIVLGFGVLIFIHELGHFIAAKWASIRVEAFAVGMGPVAVAWRKGIGLRIGSTAPEYEKRVREHLQGRNPTTLSRAASSRTSAPRDVEREVSDIVNRDELGGLDKVEKIMDVDDGAKSKRREQEADPVRDLPAAAFYRIGDSIGLGETEYSLRWLPVGGFVKMLGQEDANPNAVSDDPHSYNMRPIGKRMVVVSAGVIMNLVLAVILFVIAFMAGVRFPAAVVGDVSPILPGGRAVPENAAALGITAEGLQPGDRIVSIDGDPAKTFADVQIASAMSKPGDTLTLIVERPGVKEPLAFKLNPEKDPSTGLLSIGIAPGSSTKLISARDDDGVLAQLLDRGGLAKAGVQPGMTLLAVNDRDITAFGQLGLAANDSGGQPLQTQWASIDDKGARGAIVHAALDVRPDVEEYRQRDTSADGGLAGFSALMRVARVPDDSQNKDKIRAGDVFVRLADVPYPRQSQVYDTLQKHRRQDIEIIVLRDGEQVPLTCHVNREGQLRVEIKSADDLLVTAQPVNSFARYRTDDPTKTEDVKTAAGRAGLFSTGGTRIIQVAGNDVTTWADFRNALLEATSAATNGSDAKIDLLVQHPIPGSPSETIALNMTGDEIKRLHDLKWHVELPGYVFEPLYTVRKGSPTQAVAMGFEETRKMVVMTYLTIDRLIRGSVGVDQLRGPVGIVHIGTKVAREGLMFLLFFLGMISVNLAVINFLPLPIVDGGLFLFLVYEKFKGRPPSLAFQNAATIVGLVIIGTAFIVTFYNDVLRLIG